MAVNTLSFEQIATVMNQLYKMVTNQTAQSMVTTADFVTVAQKTLAVGYDPVLGAISQVLGRTIWGSDRPYVGKLGGLQRSAQEYGYITRKLNVSDKDFSDSEAFTLTDGQSVDMYKVNKPSVLQMNFVGQTVIDKDVTIFRTQLKNAFRSPEELGSFISMVLQNANDMIEQKRETLRRMTLANLVGGKIAANNGIIHALTEYNADTGLSLTATTVKDPANWGEFIKWLHARMADVSNMFTERTGMYQIQVTGNYVSHHTPVQDQRIFMLSKYLNAIKSRVMSGTFNDDFIKFAYTEEVSFWQSPDNLAKINVTPVYLQADGTLATAQAAVEQDNIIAVMMDRDAAGITVMDEETAQTPYNTKGKYWNINFSAIARYWNDFMEKCAVIILD